MRTRKLEPKYLSTAEGTVGSSYLTSTVDPLMMMLFSPTHLAAAGHRQGRHDRRDCAGTDEAGRARKDDSGTMKANLLHTDERSVPSIEQRRRGY